MRSYRWWSVFSKMCVLMLLVVVGSARAAVNLDKTRLVISGDEIAQAINLSNDSETPMLIQAWTDTGDRASSPDSSSTPVVVLPPVFKMLPGELRSLRLMLSSRQSLPTDRESLFWLNIYQIPPNTKTTDGIAQKVILPLRLRLKVFVRPTGLSSPLPEDEQKLRFSASEQSLRIANPTPWFMSLTVTPSGQKAIGNLMVPPMDELVVPLEGGNSVGATLSYSVITDDGNFRSYSAALER